MPEFKRAWVTLDLEWKDEISSHSLLVAEHPNPNKLLVNYREGQDGEDGAGTKKKGEMEHGEFPLFLVLQALAIMEVGMKMENTSISWTAKITLHVIVSAISVNHHRVLYLTLTWSKSGILVLLCPYNVLTYCFWQLHFPAPHQISWIPWDRCHILLSTFKAWPLIYWTHFIFLALLQKTQASCNKCMQAG